MNVSEIKQSVKSRLLYFYKKFKLNDLEFWLFKKLLKRYTSYELDQHSRWTFKSKYGDVFVSIHRQGDGYKYDKLDV